MKTKDELILLANEHPDSVVRLAAAERLIGELIQKGDFEELESLRRFEELPGRRSSPWVSADVPWTGRRE